MVTGNPLLINVVELRRAVGNQREVHEVVAIDDAALASVRVELGSSLAVDLLLETLSGGINATGTIAGRWDGECRRCLDRVSGPLEVDVAEVFEDHPTEGETYPISGDHIDLEPMVRELAILGLPINPLCSEACAGPIPDVLPVVVEDESEAEAALDPRWAALDALRSDLT
ncbi:MAG: DUF177 domain-containing protein [Acidimicrobiales bacterium]